MEENKKLETLRTIFLGIIAISSVVIAWRLGTIINYLIDIVYRTHPEL